MSKSDLYLSEAESLRGNPSQWAAYNSTGHCVVLAGPGSGKTKTLVTKLAKTLAEDVNEPRGIACITYNNECARELEDRLQSLGLSSSNRLFIGTVHSFSLTQIVMPYAEVANLGLPKNFRVASQREQAFALDAAHKRVVGGRGNPQDSKFTMGFHRRSILNRESIAWKTHNPQLSLLVEEYEKELRAQGTIDFDDMPLIAVKALRDNEWLQRAILAKYPVLFVDEYQDLGRALHRMVMGLCFSTGIRLFAVGDADQSIYGFAGAYPELLQKLAERDDVETVKLEFNYRCGSNIVQASEYALGETRGYKTPPGSHAGALYFYPLNGDYDQQSAYLFSNILPNIQSQIKDLQFGDIAILYPAAWIGDYVARSASAFGVDVIRSDTNSIYPRSRKLLRWIEDCASWVCAAESATTHNFPNLLNRGLRFSAYEITNPDARIAFQRILISYLWNNRDVDVLLYDWLVGFKNAVVDVIAQNGLTDEIEPLDHFISRCSAAGDCRQMTLGNFIVDDAKKDRLHLSTFHSAKGREFKAVVLFGIDVGRLPRNGATAGELRDARRSFYVGLTRAKQEVHIVHSASRPSQFVNELKLRLGVS